MTELIVEAKLDNLAQVLQFVDSRLEEEDCPIGVQMKIDVAVEELFVNIASYAYAPGSGSATVRMEVEEDPKTVAITFVDCGVPYDPLAKEDPDVTLSINDREIGGLGIFMVKKSMDDMIYAYENGQNVLTIRKRIG